MKIIIIGGVAGGMSAATRLRRLMEDAEIKIFEKKGPLFLVTVAYLYYISEIKMLFVQTPGSLKRVLTG